MPSERRDWEVILRRLRNQDITGAVIAERFGVSRDSAHHALTRYERQGLLTRVEFGVYRLKEERHAQEP